MEELESQPRRLARGAVAIAAGLAFGLLMWAKLRAAGPYALGYDFTWHWRAGEALRHGQSPYLVINAVSKNYPFDGGYFWWLPTAIMLEPFSLLPIQPATALFVGISTAIFTYALTVDGWWRLPFLASAPFIYGALGGQVVPLVMAAILLPALGWLAPMKYTMAVAGFAYNRSWKYATLAAAVVVVSVIIWPWWPRQWWADMFDVAETYHHFPILVPGGFLLLAALIKWRQPEARLLAIMAIYPQTMLFYDQLPLLVLARSRRQALVMALASWIAPAVAIALHGVSAERAQLFAWNAPITLVCYYFPALAIVLMRPNAPQPAPRAQT